jgi:peptidoglycan/xylan/chitin deacetylase (PgdA/CDA1 family)
MYHRIAYETFDPWGLAVESPLFEAQLRWLARHRDVMPLSEFARRHRDGRLRRDAIAITFDDAYASVLTTAAPLVKRHGLTATVFLPVALIERGRLFWWDELAQIILNFAGEKLRWKGSELSVPPPSERDRIWEPDAEPATPRQSLFHSLWSQLRTMHPDDLEQSMAELRAQSGDCGQNGEGPVSGSALRQASPPLIEFGSHALTHASLPALDDRQKRREIEESRSRCEALTGKTPVTFAYPYGDRDTASMRLAEEAGYACAVTTDPGFVTSHSDPFALPRLAVGNWRADQLSDALRGL